MEIQKLTGYNISSATSLRNFKESADPFRPEEKEMVTKSAVKQEKKGVMIDMKA